MPPKAPEKLLISLIDGYNHQLGTLVAGEPVTHDATGRELTPADQRRLAGSQHLELVSGKDEGGRMKACPPNGVAEDGQEELASESDPGPIHPSSLILPPSGGE